MMFPMTWWILCGISLESCYDLSNISPWDEIRKTHFPNFHAKRARSTALGSSESCPNKLSPKVLFFFEKIASEKNRSPAEKYPRKNSGQKPLEKIKNYKSLLSCRKSNPERLEVLYDFWTNIVPVDADGNPAPSEAPTVRHGVASGNPVFQSRNRVVSTMILLNFQPRTRGSLKISEFLKSVELSHTVAVNATTLESKTSRVSATRQAGYLWLSTGT